MLIMSSDGNELYNVDKIEYFNVRYSCDIEMKANNYYFISPNYKTKERAIQVLREIATNYATGQKVYTLPES